MKRLLLAGALGLGALVLAAPTASAHVATVACTAPGSGVWTLTNDQPDPALFTTIEGPSGTIPANGSTTVNYSGTSLTATVSWPDGTVDVITGTGECTVVGTTTTTTTTSTTTTTENPCPDPPCIPVTQLPSTTTTTTVPGATTTSTEPGETTTTVPGETTTTVPDFLSITAISPICLRDAPYIDVTFGDQPVFDGRPATVTFVDLNGVVVATHTATFQSNTTVRFIYPGASVDAAGNPTDWPGWVFDGDEWVIDPTDAFLRDGLTVVVEVNPTASDTVSYPPATPSCSANPPTDPPPGTPPGTLPLTR